MSSMSMPQDVLEAIQKLDDTDQGKVARTARFTDGANNRMLTSLSHFPHM